MDYIKYSRKRIAERTLLELQGIYTGIAIDEKITEIEKREIRHWLEKNKDVFSKKIALELETKLNDILSDSILSLEEREDLDWFIGKFTHGFGNLDLISRELVRLHGILRGILADNKINTKEAEGLRKWIHMHQHLEGIYPYDEIWSMLKAFLSDGKIDKDEEKILKAFFSDFIPSDTSLIKLDDLEEIQDEVLVRGVCSYGPDIQIEGKVFCATGVFSGINRSDLYELIESKGGKTRNSVSLNTDYLIVGSEGNQAWMYSCYGRKVEAAMQIRKNGGNIIIVHETDMRDALLGE